jgi:CRT-like, chloroquine-resistance transporter-like
MSAKRAADDTAGERLLDAGAAGDGGAPTATAAAAAAAAETRKARLLLVSFVAMVFVGCANRVLSVLQYIPMANYPLFVNLLVTGAYIPTSLLWVLPAVYGLGLKMESRPVPQRAWFVMGFLDSLASVLQALAVDYVSNGTLVTLLLQSSIPVSMGLSRVVLGTKYKAPQIGGALLVLAGLLVVLAPAMASGFGGASGAATALWGGVLILSCVPMTLSSVYKEQSLGDTEIDPIWFNYMVAVYQEAWAFPLLIPSALASGVAISDIGSNLKAGALCLAGVNTAANDDCSTAALYSSLYIVANIGYNILIILILKYGSSNILWMSLTFNVPASALIFAIPGIPGYKPLNWSVGAGLPIIMAGLIAYRFYDQAVAFARKLLGYAPPPEPAADAKELADA